MRHILWPSIGLFVLVTASLMADGMLGRKIDGLLVLLDDAEQAVQVGDWGRAEQATSRLAKESDRKRNLLSSFLPHDETEQQTDLVRDLQALAANRDREEYLRAATALRAQLLHMRDLDRLKFGIVF